MPDRFSEEFTAVFVDVLRATSTLLAVGAARCRGIYVSVKPRDAATYPFVPPDGAPTDRPWVFGGELNGLPITGHDSDGNEVPGVISNSPLEASEEVLGGKYLRFFSTNGSEILQSVLDGGILTIFAMALANVEATVNRILEINPGRIWFTCGAFYGGQTLEDGVVAGLAIDRLVERGFASEDQLDDEAWNMLYSARLFQVDGVLDTGRLLARVERSQVGNLLRNIGRYADLPATIELEGFEPELLQNMRNTVLRVDQETGPFVVPERINGDPV